jgi:hypothetical protein
MANALYDKGRQKFLDGDLDWSAHDIIVLLVTSGYTADLANDEFIDDIGGANEVDRSGNLASKTSTAGVADAANITLPTVTGSAVAQVIIARDTGNDATSPLIARIDTATNLPFTPNGGDITVQWDNGANKIFKL